MKLKHAYCDAVRNWDRKIRLVGKIPVETLYEESLEALQSQPIVELNTRCIVDIGAGNGILGVPWLDLSPENKCIFVEPDLKKAAFLLDFMSHADSAFSLPKRSLVLTQKLEDVPRETLLAYSKSSYCLVTRAFSGPRSLKEAFDLSHLKKEDLFVFSLVNGSTCFKKL